MADDRSDGFDLLDLAIEPDIETRQRNEIVEKKKYYSAYLEMKRQLAYRDLIRSIGSDLVRAASVSQNHLASSCLPRWLVEPAGLSLYGGPHLTAAQMVTERPLQMLQALEPRLAMRQQAVAGIEQLARLYTPALFPPPSAADLVRRHFEQWRPVVQSSGAARLRLLREDYEREGNPLYAFQAVIVAANTWNDIPEWVLDYLREAAERLVAYQDDPPERTAPAVAKALGFPDGRGEKSPFRAAAKLDRDRELFGMVAARIEAGEKEYLAIESVSLQESMSISTVRRAYKFIKDLVDQIDASEAYED